MARTNLILLFSFACDVMATQEVIDVHNTMCSLEEDVYISCTLMNTVGSEAETVASVCAKNNSSPDEGYVQYRYGTPGAAPDLVYPLKKISPKGIFEMRSGEPGVSHEMQRYLRFSSDGYLYSFERKGLEGYWLVINGAKGEVFRRYCDRPGKNYLSDKASRGIGG